MENPNSPELEQCNADLVNITKTRDQMQDKFSNDMQDASVVQGDASSQQSELKNMLEDFINTRKEWIEVKTKINVLTAQYNHFESLIGGLRVRYKGCMDAIEAAAKAKAEAAKAQKK